MEIYENGWSTTIRGDYSDPVTNKLESDMTGLWLIASDVKIPTISKKAVVTYEFFDETDDILRFREAYVKERRKGTLSLANADSIVVKAYGTHVDSLLVGSGLLYGIFKVFGIYGKEEIEVITLTCFHVSVAGTIPPCAFEENFTFKAKLTMNSFKVNISNVIEWSGDRFEEFNVNSEKQKTVPRSLSQRLFKF